MQPKQLVLLVCLVLSVQLMAQNNFSYSPENPKPGDQITITYEPAGALAGSMKPVEASFYALGYAEYGPKSIAADDIVLKRDGKKKNDGKLLGIAYHNEESIEFSNDDPTTLDYEEGAGFGIMKRFDYGLNGTAGLEGKSMVLSVNYGLGLAKLQSGSNSGEDNNNKHRVLSISIGFKL